MSTPIGKKRVVFFLPPEMVRAVKMNAAAGYMTQSDVVEAAITQFLTKTPRQPKATEVVTLSSK